MKHQKKVLIFDFDGTIADSFKIFLQTLNLITDSKYDVSKSSITALKKMTMPQIIKKLNIKRWKLPFLVLKGRKQLSKKIEFVKPFNSMEQTISTLHDNGYIMYILSSNDATAINKFLQKHQMAKYFCNVYGNAGLLSKAKAINKLIKKEHLVKSNCIYIGDEMRDVEASNKAGIDVISVDWGFSDGDALRSINKNVVSSQKELISLLIPKKSVNSQD